MGTRRTFHPSWFIPGILVTGIFLLSVEILFAQEKTARQYQIPGHGLLELTVPAAWRDEVEQSLKDQPPTLTFQPKSGEMFEVLITVMWSPTGEKSFNTAETLRPIVARHGKELLPTAVESRLVIEELRSPSVVGYYYVFTDKAPKPGEYEYLTQGGLNVGDLLLSFTILTHTKNGGPVQDSLRMLQSAKQRVKLQSEMSTKELAIELIDHSRRGDTEMVASVLAKGIDPNIGDEEGHTALMKAARNGHMGTVQLLLSAGANVKAKTRGTRIGGFTVMSGQTALMMAARWGHTETVRILIEAGADPNEKNDIGFTTLMSAAVFGHADIIKILLDEGADVHARGPAGGTALMTTALHGHTETVQLLLAAGADVNARDKEGDTALLAAVRSGAGPTMRHTRTVEMLLAAGAKINEKNNVGETALMAAAINGHTPTAKVLLANGADANAKSFNGWTPLKLAKKKNHTAIIELLLKAGANDDRI